jgi:hypothetical protein
VSAAPTLPRLPTRLGRHRFALVAFASKDGELRRSPLPSSESRRSNSSAKRVASSLTTGTASEASAPVRGRVSMFRTAGYYTLTPPHGLLKPGNGHLCYWLKMPRFYSTNLRLGWPTLVAFSHRTSKNRFMPVVYAQLLMPLRDAKGVGMP